MTAWGDKPKIDSHPTMSGGVVVVIAIKIITIGRYLHKENLGCRVFDS